MATKSSVGTAAHTPAPEESSHEKRRKEAEMVKRQEKVDELVAAIKNAEDKRNELEVKRAADIEELKKVAQELEAERKSIEQEARDMEAEAMRDVHKIEWASVQDATDYEERIKALEQVLQEERRTHAEELGKQALLVTRTRDEAELKVKEAEQRHDVRLAELAARIREAEETAEVKKQWADKEVVQIRTRQETRVKDIRQKADARLRESAEQKKVQLDQMHDKVLQRQRLMEGTLISNARKKTDALSEARNIAASMEKDLRELRVGREADFIYKDGQFEAWKSAQRVQNSIFIQEHKQFLKDETTLHSKATERTMGCIAQLLKRDEDHAGSSRQAVDDLLAPELS